MQQVSCLVTPYTLQTHSKLRQEQSGFNFLGWIINETKENSSTERQTEECYKYLEQNLKTGSKLEDMGQFRLGNTSRVQNIRRGSLTVIKLQLREHSETQWIALGYKVLPPGKLTWCYDVMGPQTDTYFLFTINKQWNHSLQKNSWSYT